MKNKIVTAILAFFLGMVGVHRFYLGRWWQGALMALTFFITMMITIEEHAPAILIPIALGFIDAVLFAVMPKEDFDEKYNRKKNRRRRSYQQWNSEEDYEEEYEQAYEEVVAPKKQMAAPKAQGTAKPSKAEALKRMGIEKFRRYDFEGAIESFILSLEENISSPSTHFNLACCYSMIENGPKAMHHLDRAVENGFIDFPKIHSHQALAYLRRQADFQAFVDNGYRTAIPQAKPLNNLFEAPAPASTTQETSGKDTLDEILHLGDLRDKGLITEEEFVQQKKKLLA
jgi:TM2 domain/Short C-terminal domain